MPLLKGFFTLKLLRVYLLPLDRFDRIIGEQNIGPDFAHFSPELRTLLEDLARVPDRNDLTLQVEVIDSFLVECRKLHICADAPLASVPSRGQLVIHFASVSVHKFQFVGKALLTHFNLL